MMDVIATLTSESERAGRAHGMFQMAIAAVLRRILDQPNPEAIQSRGKLQTELLALESQTEAIILQPVLTAELKLMRYAYEQNAVEFQPIDGDDAQTFADKLKLTLKNDSQHVVAVWQRFALTTQLAQSQGASRAQALIRGKYGLMTNIRFTRVDRGGRRWVSGVYSENLVRGYLLNAYIVAYLHAMTLKGQDVAMVTNVDENHRHYGLRFSITGTTPNLPTFEQIRSEVWHPNSNALVTQG